MQGAMVGALWEFARHGFDSLVFDLQGVEMVLQVRIICPQSTPSGGARCVMHYHFIAPLVCQLNADIQIACPLLFLLCRPAASMRRATEYKHAQRVFSGCSPSTLNVKLTSQTTLGLMRLFGWRICTQRTQRFRWTWLALLAIWRSMMNLRRESPWRAGSTSLSRRSRCTLAALRLSPTFGTH